jgi:hypothetical protein
MTKRRMDGWAGSRQLMGRRIRKMRIRISKQQHMIPVKTKSLSKLKKILPPPGILMSTPMLCGEPEDTRSGREP